MNYYQNSTTEVIKKLKTNQEKGLSTEEVNLRLKKYGKNELTKSRARVTRLQILLDQFKSPLLLILIVAGAISLILTEFIDAIVIFITVALNGIIGFIQEDKANESLKKISQMITYKALVIRDGEKHQISSSDLVPGDIIIIEAGDKIQADGRILQETNFLVNEAALTGESEPINKNTGQIKKETSIADRKNMVHRGTIAADGRAKIVVTATGGKTELGKIADLVKQTEELKTPLQNQLGSLSKKIGILVLFLVLIIFMLGIFSPLEKHGLFEMFETAVAVAVAAIPEGLAITLTVILAIGMRTILKRKSLVRKLVAAETLGSVSVICTDKTGTVTEGRMKITRIITGSSDLEQETIYKLDASDPERHCDALTVLRAGVLANDGVIENGTKDERDWKMIGDFTDTAFIYTGMKVGLKKIHLESANPRIQEMPFSSIHKYIATLHHVEDEYKIFVKGAPDEILKRCVYFQNNGKSEKMEKNKKVELEKTLNELTEMGLRVIGVAYKRTDEIDKLEDKNINDLIFAGLVALSDPLRPDVKETIALARQAGIRTILITGDHAKTAASIAKQIGLTDGKIIDGKTLEKMSNNELMAEIKYISVFARVDPAHKIRIVKALQENGEVVAMTGDGVNDAPALKGADIGVALGSGTDVAKETSDIVLMDNAYSTIVAAVEEGRRIYQNIKKVVLFLLSDSFTEVSLIAGSLILGMPLAILPAQILWVNLIEDSFPNIALAFDKGDKENMFDPPRPKNSSIFDKQMKIMVIMIATITNIALFAVFVYFFRSTNDIVLTRTLVFVALGFDSLLFVYPVRSMRHMVWQMNPFSNKYITYSVLFGAAMLTCSVYLPPLQTLLQTTALSWQHWGIVLLFGLLNVALIEVMKGILIVRHNNNRA